MSSEVKVYIGADASDFSAKMKLANEKLEEFKKNTVRTSEVEGLRRMLGPAAIIEGFKVAIDQAQKLRDAAIESGKAVSSSVESVARFGDAVGGIWEGVKNGLVATVGFFTKAGENIGDAISRMVHGDTATNISEQIEAAADLQEAKLKALKSVIGAGDAKEALQKIKEAREQLEAVGEGSDARVSALKSQADEANALLQESNAKLAQLKQDAQSDTTTRSTLLFGEEQKKNWDLREEALKKQATYKQADYDRTQKIADANNALNDAQRAASETGMGAQAQINKMRERAIEMAKAALAVQDDEAKKKQMEAQAVGVMNEANDRQRQLDQQIAGINLQIAAAQETRKNIGLSQVEVAKQEYDQAQKLFDLSKQAGDSGDPKRSAELRLQAENMLNDSIAKQTAYKEALVSLEEKEHQMMMDRASIGATTEQNINAQLSNAYNILNNIAPLEQNSLNRANMMLTAQQQITAALQARYNLLSSNMSLEEIAKGSSTASVHARNSLRLKNEADEADKAGNYEYGIKLRQQANAEQQQALAPEANAVKKALGLNGGGSGQSSGGEQRPSDVPGKFTSTSARGQSIDAGNNARVSSLDAGIALAKSHAATLERSNEYYDAATGKINTLPLNVAGHATAPAKSGDNPAKQMQQTFQSIDKQMTQLVTGLQKLGVA